jgi:rubredoxin
MVMCHVPPCRAKQRGLADPAAARPDVGMRVACPGCGTEYEAPDQAVRRALRCVACGHVFRAGGGVPPPPAPPSDSPAEPAPAASHRPAESLAAEDLAPAAPDRAESLAAAPASVPGVSTAPRVAWGASIALLVGAGIALHAFRAQIAEAWPPMLRLYRALGLL